MRPMMNLSHLVSFEQRYCCGVLTVFIDGEDALRSCRWTRSRKGDVTRDKLVCGLATV
jgi:hypothetical protein